MKKNNTMKLMAIILLIAMIALILVSGTYAKYTSSATGTSSARVAKWSFSVGTTNITATDTFTFNLFDTIKDTDGSTNETDVKSSDKVIAPGTSGSFDIVLKNDSEVSAKYAIDYTVNNPDNIPVEFSVDGTNWNTTLADVGADDTATKIGVDAADKTKTITVQWRWAYEGGKYVDTTNAEKTADDAYDTTLGKDGTKTLEVIAKVTATQVD